jgi:D-amino-acid oxidase
MPQKIAIVGAGVIGLTSGIRLLEQGHDVTVFARDIDTNITSRAAPAIWLPYKAAPEELILQWSKRSLEIYHDLNVSDGIEEMELTEYYHENHNKPLWTKILKNYRELSTAELLPGYAKGFTTRTYQIDTSIYVDQLLTLFKKLGGNIFQKTFQQLQDVDGQFPIIINCSGVWSSQLVPDKESFPIRGQYILVEKPRGLNKITFATNDDNGYTLIVPRQHDCYLGGTTLYHDWDTAIRPETTTVILGNAEQIEPRLAGMQVLKTGVGLRPGRRAVRLEAERLEDNRQVIHNYGHGGSGFTVGWGAAEDVVKLVQANPA